MNKEEINNFNKKCAIFLNWYPSVDGNLWYKNLTSPPYCKTNELKFHSDWNWIMDVINKIRLEWRFDITHHGSVSRSRLITIDIWQKYSGGGEDLIVDKIESEYPMIASIQAIDKFIDKYNHINK